VGSLADAARPGVKIAIGAPSVPIGAYTRQVLARLGPATARAVQANVRSEEPDVAGIVGKLTQGAADAGFVYMTDVRASGGRLRAIPLPPRAQPRVVYAAAVVRGTSHRAAARAFVRGLLSGAGRRALLAAGFEPPPPR
jgi:molybdate transport system substrate-binding protein